MNLNYVREFVTLTQVGKYQEAAELLYLSQSTLSKHITALEKDLGADLFLRLKKRKTELTPFGKSFLPYALQLTNIYDDMNAKLLQYVGRSMKKITIGSSPVVTLYKIFNSMDIFLKKNPDLHIEFIDASQETLYELLRTGICNLIIAQDCEGASDSEFNKIPYTQDQMALLLPLDHPLAGRKAVTFDEIAGEAFIQVSQAPLSRDPGLSRRFPVQEQIIVGRASTVIDLIERHRGVSIMPKNPAEHFSGGRVAIVELQPAASVSYHILYPKNQALPAYTKALLDFMRN